jgi:hypothetical protein
MSSAALRGREKAHAAAPRLNLHLLHVHREGSAPAVTARRPSCCSACDRRFCDAIHNQRWIDR